MSDHDDAGGVAGGLEDVLEDSGMVLMITVSELRLVVRDAVREAVTELRAEAGAPEPERMLQFSELDRQKARATLKKLGIPIHPPAKLEVVK